MWIKKIVIMTSFLWLSSCQNSVYPRPADSSVDLFSFLISNQNVDQSDYNSFLNTWVSAQSTTIDNKLLEELNTIFQSSTGMTSVNFQTLYLNNGEIILLELTPETEDGAYKILNIHVIPLEDKEAYLRLLQ